MRAVLPIALLNLLAACAGLSESRDEQALAGRWLHELRQQAGAPAMGAAVASSRGVEFVLLQGHRRQGADEPARRDDAFHLGSVTKLFTATLAGQLVAEGRLRWETRLVEVFPRAVAQGRPEYREVTLAMLLAHQAGFPALTTAETLAAVPEFSGTPRAQRRAFTTWLLRRPPAVRPGNEHYSNAGYGVAAAMLEAVSGRSWETLLRERLLKPLDLRTAGFGWPGEHDPAGGHLLGHWVRDGRLVPVAPDGPYQFRVALAPAGDLHASLQDVAHFAAAWLRALHGEAGILEPDAARRMLAFRGGLGWGVRPGFGYGTVALHEGSAGTFYMVLLLIPEADRAFVVAANAATPATERALKRLLRRLVRQQTPPRLP